METILSPTMQEATNVFISNLLASEAFIRYHQSQTLLDHDSKAQALLNQLSQAQTDLRKKQAESSLSKDEIDSLRALQTQARENDVIQGYADAQQDVIKFLREINEEINQLLGIDFASFTKHSGCC
ncbi:MAG: hypothetical protein A2029_16060 [Chloroflexi bacterium RBG_19FT_COMBO_47_9]|nr:MAG: hypothetical protein A2029_16060 [Chloroflexi bacterium RBG_19FT_COMBO_47_9]